MENKLFFSIAKYVPNLLRDEKINLGFCYFYPYEKKLGYIPSKNTNRILAFDDELDKDTLMMLHADLSYEFSNDSFEFDDDEELTNSLFSKTDKSILQHKTKNYVNQIQFTDVLSIIVEDSIEKGIKDICDIYLYYDRSIRERRFDRDRIKQLTKKIIKSNFDKDSYAINIKNTLSFSKEPYDFKILVKGEYKYIKALTFDYRNYNKLYDELKIYLYDLQNAFQNNPSLNSDDFIVVINNTEYDQIYEKVAKEILESKVELVTLEDLSEKLRPEDLFYS